MPNDNEIDVEIKAHQQLAILIVNLCDPEPYHDSLKEFCKKKEINRVKNELFFLLYFAIDMLLHGLCCKYAEKYKEEQKAEYSLTGVKLANIQALFKTGHEYLAQKRGISNPGEEIEERFRKYGEAFRAYGSPTGMMKIGSTFIECCSLDFNFAFAMVITKLFSDTRIATMDLLKDNLLLPE